MATRKLLVEVVGDASSLSRAFRGASADSTRLGGSIGKLSVGFGQLVKGVLIVDAVQKALEGLHATVHLGIEEFTEHAKVSAQTEAALKSTGGVANVTAKQIDALGLSLSNLSGVDDELIQSGANVLLGFQNIRDFAGKNNDIFTQATKATLDFAVRSGRSVPAAAVAIGRALQDPAKAAGSLRRAYVVLTAAEKTAIATAVRHGDTLKAQQLIVADLNKRYGGAAEALGKTLPGQLNVLRDRFKDLAGELVGAVAPATTKAVTGLTDFVKNLSEIKGTRAKFDFTIDTGRDAAKSLFEKLRKEFDSIDWSAVGKTIQDGIRTIPPEIAHAIGGIDFGAAGHALGDKLKALLKFGAENLQIEVKEIADGFKQINFGAIGRDLGNAVSRLANDLTNGVRKVDWNKVGRALVQGAEAIVVAVARFLAGVDWGRVLSSIGRLVGAAAVGIGRVLLGIGEELGRQILSGIGKGFGALGALIGRKFDDVARFLVDKSLKLVLKIIEPFTHLPGLLGGGEFRKLQAKLQGNLATIENPAFAAGKRVGDQVIAGINAGLQGPIGTPTIPGIPVGPSGPTAAATISHRDRDFATKDLPPPPAPTPPKRKGITAAQRNTFFDNAISSDLTRAGLLPGIKAQIAALQRVAGLISARLAATKDVTRRRTLEDQLLSVQSTIRGDQLQVGQDFLSSLQFGITEAQATQTFKDDIPAFQALVKGIRAQIKATGDTLDLEQQLFEAQQGLKQARTSVLSAKDFKILGFGPTGEDIIPGKNRLKKELTDVQGLVAGTKFDTPKVRGQLEAISKLLHDKLVPADIRSKMQELLSNLEKQLKDHAGNLTKTTALNASRVLAGLGLGPDAERTLRARLSHFNSAGKSLVGTGSGSGSRPRPGQAFGARQLNVTVQSPDIYVDGTKLTSTVSGRQRKTAARNPGQRRGPNAGLVIT